MRTRLAMVTIASALALSIASCATQEGTGTLVGGTAGAALGGALTGSGWGALIGGGLGAAIGNRVGAEMDRRDRERMAYALSQVPTNQPYQWVNPDTGAAWQVTPQRPYASPASPPGYPCREFSVMARIGGRMQETYGTACLQPDGSWQMVG